MAVVEKDCVVPAMNCPLHRIPGVTRTRASDKLWRRGVAMAVGIGITGGSFLVGIGWAVYANIRPPIITQNSTILNPEVPLGEDLVFRIQAMTSPDLSCIGKVTREFFMPMEVAGKTLRFKKRNEGPAPIIEPNESDYVIGVPLPPNMWLGDWWFQGETTYDCGYLWAMMRDFPTGLVSGGTLRFRTKKMPFKVVAPRTVQAPIPFDGIILDRK